ncbi:MAG: 6-carboxytetrahydropterin synthase QueD [Deltaproteobacteria bacterium]|nr:6-carboxytetrahydropterin synthase QueD [Deltaproteobacteria bacterium]
MPGIFEIYVKTHFSAAHFLRGYPGDCARIHGHNWGIEVFVKCSELDGIGIGIDFRDIKQTVNEILEGLDHSNLNDHPAFTDVNPTSENLARFLYKEIGNRLNTEKVRISRVIVSETPNAGAGYREE